MSDERLTYKLTSRSLIHRAVAAITAIAATFVMSISLAVAEPVAAVWGDAQVAHALLNQPAGPPVDQSRLLHITFAFKRDSAKIDDYLAQLQSPSSPYYHQWLTASEYGQRFGPPMKDIQAMSDWATENGFTVTRVWQNQCYVSATATVATAQKAFNTRIRTFYRPSKDSANAAADLIFAPESEPEMPASLAGSLEFIGGLTNAIRAVRPKHLNTVIDAPTSFFGPASARPLGISKLTDPLDPAQLAQIYDVSRLQSIASNGQGERIAVYSPVLYSKSDVATFETTYDITSPAPTEEWPSSTGRTTDSAPDDEAESALDIEMIAGQAQSAQIVLYEGPNDGSSVFDEFNQIAEDDNPVLSISYTFPEETSDASGLTELNSIFQQMATEGISVLSASGDNGPYDDSTEPNTLSVGMPASSPYAIGVGGSALPNSNGGYWNSEIAWNDSTGSTGGGNSIIFKQPAWQTGPGVTNNSSTGYREVPDVAAIAGSPGVSIYTGGAWVNYGGTSISAPLWASATCLFDKAAGSRMGLYAPALYTYSENPAVYAATFHDITSGSNALFSCTPGWDYLTGLGSADFYELYLYLDSAPIVQGFPAGLQMISVPYSYSGEALTSLFDGSPTFAVWDPGTGAYNVTPKAPADSIQAGAAYWVRNAEALNLLHVGAPVSGPESVSLSAGWNMIGDPFTTAIPLSSLQVTTSGGTTLSFAQAVAKGYVIETLYTYPSNIGAYMAVTSSESLEPYVGYWIEALQPCTLVVPPSA